ncbi:MAG: hypothetical protein ABIW82_07330 [Dokdonella sp.]
METMLRRMFLVLVMAALTACHGPSEAGASLPPLEGLYRTSEGVQVRFFQDGTFESPGGRGRFTVDGSGLTITGAGGMSASGSRVGPDEVVLTISEHTEQHFFRVGSTVAQTSRANTPPSKPMPSAVPPEAAKSPEPDIDRSLPFDRYTQLDLTDPTALRFLVAAYRKTQLTDDEKLSFLSLAGANETDAFKRHELLAKELPAIDAKLSAYKAQRYYSMTVFDPLALQKLAPHPRPAAAWTTTLGAMNHYDFNRKGFPGPCVADGVIGGGKDISLFFGGYAHLARRCVLEVKDEALAKTIEATANQAGVLPVSATFYVYVVGEDTQAPGLDVVPVRAHVRFYAGTLSAAHPDPVAELDVNLPQPSYP